MKSGQKILNYGLYGEADEPLVTDFVHCEPLETRSQRYNWEIEPHLHTQLCQLFLFESGAVTLNRHDLAVALPVPCLLLIPENTLHGFSYPAPATGRVLTLSASFLNALFAHSLSVLQILGDLRIVAADAQPDAFGAIVRLLTEIQNELFTDLLDRHRALQSQLTLLFIALCRVSEQPPETRRPEDRNLNYYTDFQQLIRQSYRLKWPLSRYAHQLSITPVHLNRICRFVAGRTASEVVQDYGISLAKRYLTHTSYSVSEIAFLLSFEHPGYFARLFRQHVGLSPTAFREQMIGHGPL